MATEIDVECKYCSKIFRKELRYVKAAEKKGRDHFCSLSCNISFRNKTDNRFQHTEHLQKGSKKDELSDFKFYFRKAKSRKKLGKLTLKDIKECWENQKGLCAITGLPLKLNGYHTDQFDCASLDRIDSNRPYEIDNIQFITLCLNYAKNNADNDRFIEYLRQIKFP